MSLYSRIDVNVFAWVTFIFVVALTLGSRAPKINKVTLGNDMRLKQTTYDLCDYKVNSMQLHRNYIRLFDLLFTTTTMQNVVENCPEKIKQSSKEEDTIILTLPRKKKTFGESVLINRKKNYTQNT